VEEEWRFVERVILNGDGGEDTSVPRSTEVSMALANAGRDDDMARSCKSLRALKKYVRRR
jgi:hypothetical protein